MTRECISRTFEAGGIPTAILAARSVSTSNNCEDMFDEAVRSGVQEMPLRVVPSY